nr:hypothetical protein CFP56_21589 [Quercus suber]
MEDLIRAFTYAQGIRVAALVVTVSPDPADHIKPFESVGMTPCNRLQTFILIMQLQTYGTRHVSSPRTADSVLQGRRRQRRVKIIKVDRARHGC